MLWVKIILFYILRTNPESRKLGFHGRSWISSSAGTTWASLNPCMSGPHLLVTSELLQFSSPMPEITSSSLKIHEAWALQLAFNRNVWPICFCSYRLQFTDIFWWIPPVPSAVGTNIDHSPFWGVVLNTVQHRTHNMLWREANWLPQSWKTNTVPPQIILFLQLECSSNLC